MGGVEVEGGRKKQNGAHRIQQLSVKAGSDIMAGERKRKKSKKKGRGGEVGGERKQGNGKKHGTKKETGLR